ncbi:MAG TPA: hypothetical protein PKY78_09330 [Candidatus Omnitrophota bacterium]|nr:hypothetical protein [Candidatus Omnitrophota bacterium]HPS21169.1 hypothetical protein [Candidatus Omnitrophota bacterium]
MKLVEILEKCNALGIAEKRNIAEDYCEIVFLAKEIDEWNTVFSGIFGPAVKPKGTKPTRQDSEITSEFGGIYTNQVLYKKGFDEGTVIAMFWPWQDGNYITLKIARIAKK